MGYKKYAKTQGILMLKFFNANQKNFLKKLEFVLNSRKLKQQNKSNLVKQILINVKKKAIEQY